MTKTVEKMIDKVKLYRVDYKDEKRDVMTIEIYLTNSSNNFCV
jgi:hypothetical protein